MSIVIEVAIAIDIEEFRIIVTVIDIETGQWLYATIDIEVRTIDPIIKSQ